MTMHYLTEDIYYNLSLRQLFKDTTATFNSVISNCIKINLAVTTDVGKTSGCITETSPIKWPACVWQKFVCCLMWKGWSV